MLNMSDEQERALFWSGFLVNNCDCPEADILRQHLAGATFRSFCDCGCSSFQVSVADRASLRPLRPPTTGNPGVHSAFFDFDLELPDGRHLALIAFCDADGILWGIDIDINCNTEPVPAPAEVKKLLGL